MASESIDNLPNSHFWNNKKVLITGHTGFKGSWLAFWLKMMGSNIYGISLPPNKEKNLFDALKLREEVNHIILDIRNKEKIKKSISEIKPDFLFHLAAQPLVIEGYKNPAKTWETI